MTNRPRSSPPLVCSGPASHGIRSTSWDAGPHKNDYGRNPTRPPTTDVAPGLPLDLRLKTQVCARNSYQGLHVHHIVPRRQFYHEEKGYDYEQANNLDNLITLCTVHHVVWERCSPLCPDIR
ncbi:HNH endonuclease [Natronosalvus rutilus]|uniref:HNH endonuclease n=1 Tax=Natronosalvus rutilus TaxID=2953753 RepID=A0A9E7NCD5_9EURY|nr:HNH endonuclease [Natronosalvus rutilus]UTF54871.1 HNH endonuclease [Natronosalvus rutilus]